MKILIVDDDPQILDALTVGFQFQWQGARIISAPNGEAALSSFFESQPDIVVLDIAMPGKSGLEVLKEIRAVSDVPVILLTAMGQETDQVRGLEMGADDYVVKPFGHMALMARVRAVMRRAELPPPPRLSARFVAGNLEIDFDSGRVTLAGEAVALTPVEYRLLYHLARNAGRVMPHQALLHHLWGADYSTTPSHLKVFVSRLRSKIEVEGQPPFIETLRGVGYRFVIPAERQPDTIH